MKVPSNSLFAMAAVAALLAGCSSTKLDETPVETRTPIPTGPSGGSGPGGGASTGTAATTTGTAQSSVAAVDLSRSAGKTGAVAAPLGRVVYFDYDSFAIKDDYRALIDGHAKALAAQRARRLVIEGHTDERGGREYNLALGQKRAESVAKQLQLLGAAEAQLEAVSFGKERPAAAGSDEAAWAKNRRAELRDR